MRSKISYLTTMTVLAFGLGVAAAAPMNAAHAQQEPIYGSQLMTEQERTEFRAKMRAAATNEQREQIRWEHHIRMQERAKDRGVNLPEGPPMFGMHQNPGRGRDGGGRLRVPQGGGRRGG